MVVRPARAADQRADPNRSVAVRSPSNDYDQSVVDAFRSGLRQVGLIENRDIVLDIVWTSGSDVDTDKAVVELIGRGAELLVPTGSTASVAVKRHTSTIPIVFISVGNPVAMGLVENLAHPGGNATGFSDIFSDLSAKLVEFGRAVNKQDTVDYLWHTRVAGRKKSVPSHRAGGPISRLKVAATRNS
jgi:putative ABC transport system substrate-binding protein